MGIGREEDREVGGEGIYLVVVEVQEGGVGHDGKATEAQPNNAIHFEGPVGLGWWWWLRDEIKRAVLVFSYGWQYYRVMGNKRQP